MLNYLWWWNYLYLSLFSYIAITIILLAVGKKKKDLKYINIAQAFSGMYLTLFTIFAHPFTQDNYVFFSVLIIMNFQTYKAEYVNLSLRTETKNK